MSELSLAVVDSRSGANHRLVVKRRGGPCNGEARAEVRRVRVIPGGAGGANEVGTGPRIDDNTTPEDFVIDTPVVIAGGRR